MALARTSLIDSAQIAKFFEELSDWREESLYFDQLGIADRFLFRFGDVLRLSQARVGLVRSIRGEYLRAIREVSGKDDELRRENRHVHLEDLKAPPLSDCEPPRGAREKRRWLGPLYLDGLIRGLDREPPVDLHDTVGVRPLQRHLGALSPADLLAVKTRCRERIESWLPDFPELTESDEFRRHAPIYRAFRVAMVSGWHVRIDRSPVFDRKERDFADGSGRLTLDVASAASNADPVLLRGATGTGKEVVARAIHALSEAADGPFIVANIGGLDRDLANSHLFGHVKGAFTGAIATSEGMFKRAHKGTLFLDEIGDAPMAVQVKLLRALSDRRIEPVGGGQQIPVHVRVIAATNVDLEAKIEAGEFREDLYYRLRPEFAVHLLSLQERSHDDVERLWEIEMARRVEDLIHRGETDDATMLRESVAAWTLDHRDHTILMRRHGWNGNVRQLIYFIDDYVRVCVGMGGFELPIREYLERRDGVEGRRTLEPTELVSIDAALAEIEHAYLEAALEKAGRQHADAARLVGLAEPAFRKRLQRLAARLFVNGAVERRSRQKPSNRKSSQAGGMTYRVREKGEPGRDLSKYVQNPAPLPPGSTTARSAQPERRPSKGAKRGKKKKGGILFIG